MFDGFRVIALLIAYSILISMGLSAIEETIRQQELAAHMDRIERNVGYPQ